MELQLIKGSFTQTEAIELISQMINVKIKFHEHKIENSHNEEDIKMREQRIKQLQKDLSEARQQIISAGENCDLEAVIKLK